MPPVQEEQEVLEALVQRVADLQQHHAANPRDDDEQQATFSALSITSKLKVLNKAMETQGTSLQQDVRGYGVCHNACMPPGTINTVACPHRWQRSWQKLRAWNPSFLQSNI